MSDSPPAKEPSLAERLNIAAEKRIKSFEKRAGDRAESRISQAEAQLEKAMDTTAIDATTEAAATLREKATEELINLTKKLNDELK